MSMWLSLFLGCGAKSTDSAVTEDPIPPCSDCIFQDANNYSYTSSLDITNFSLMPESNVRISWADLSIDVQGHEIAPSAIEQVTLVAFLHMTPEEIQDQLANDTLQQADISLYVVCEPTEASCMLGDFGILGADLYVPEYFAAGQGVWMLALRSGQTKGAHAFSFLTPASDSSETDVNITNETSELNVDVDFKSLRPVVLPSQTADINIDWRDIEHDGLGNEVEPSKIDSVFVARYDQSVTELEDVIFDLMTDADALWTMPLDTSGTANLQDLVGEEPFPGIDSEHRWLLALECSSCISPAPRFVTRLQTP